MVFFLPTEQFSGKSSRLTLYWSIHLIDSQINLHTDRLAMGGLPDQSHTQRFRAGVQVAHDVLLVPHNARSISVDGRNWWLEVVDRAVPVRGVGNRLLDCDEGDSELGKRKHFA